MPTQKVEHPESIIPRKRATPPGESAEKGLITLPGEAERLLREYLKRAPIRNTFPHPRDAHEWLGRVYENQGRTQAAIDEYEEKQGGR